MRIGIDAKWYFEGPISNQIVVRHLVKHFVAVNQEDDLFFFLDQKYRHHAFPFQGERIHTIYVWARINQLSNVFLLPRFARRYRLDVVLFQNFGTYFGKFKKVVYIHDVIFLSNPEYFSWKERLYFSPMSWLSKFSDRIITISQSEKKRMLRHGVGNADKIQVVLHGNDPEFAPRETYDAESLSETRERYQLPEKYILFVGRLNIRKNIQGLFQAMALMKNKHLPLVIVGEPEWKTVDLDALMQTLKLQDRIVFTGGVSKADLQRIYALAHFFCFPSYAEGFGLPALEAMSAGVPTVVAENSSLPEVCGDAALYVQPDKPESIAAALNQLDEDPECYQSLREKGFARVKQFDWKTTAADILTLLKRTT